MGIFERIDRWLCKIGLHRMRDHGTAFYDCIGMMPVYEASCACKKNGWLVDTTFPFPFFKVDREKK